MLSFRTDITPQDIANVRDIVVSTHFFDAAPDEIDVALELVQTALDKGNNVDNYQFLFAMQDGKTVGYTCFARVPCTVSTFEMYWLGVHNDLRGTGIGKQIVREALKMMKAAGATKVVLETAGRAQYIPTQKFYVACGFTLEARIKDYFAKGDDNLFFSIEP